MLKLYFDGYCETNPGTIGGFGIIIYKDVEIIKTMQEKFAGKEISNNVAEYKGLLMGLLWLLNTGYNHEEIEIYGDSQLVIMQMNGLWKIKKGIYRSIALETKALVKRFKNINFNWIPREKNTIADKLSKPADKIYQKEICELC